MHAGVGAIDGVDVAAVVDFEVVGLDGRLAAFGSVGRLDAALVRLVAGRRYVIADLAWMKRVANVDGAHPGIEPCREEGAFGVHRRLVLVGRMRAEAPAARA